jgi:hypothetical protein
VTFDAVDFNSRARFVVEFSIAVRILLEMTVDTMHPFFEMNVLKMDGLFKFLWIVKRYELSVGIQEIPFSIAFVHGAEHPSVSVKIRELRLLEPRIEVGHIRQEFRIGPKSERPRLRLAR